MTHVAELNTEHFQFMAIGGDETEARERVADAFLRHLAQRFDDHEVAREHFIAEIDGDESRRWVELVDDFYAIAIWDFSEQTMLRRPQPDSGRRERMSATTKPTYGEMRSRAEQLADAEHKEYILAGLEALQEKYGDAWVERINCKTLALELPAQCVLGQACGAYELGVDELMEYQEGASRTGWAIEHGFWTYGDWSKLDDSWHRVLCDRQEAEEIEV